MNTLDRRARGILFSTYWSSSGWRPREEQKLSHEDFAYAKAAGLMFDPVYLGHDDVVRDARQLVRDLEPHSVANAFVASLSSRRLELRSALGSFAVLRHLPAHRAHGDAGRCRVCGWFLAPHPLEEDLSLFNFERLKWGGLRHLDPAYATFDLEQFSKLAPLEPTREDVSTLRSVLRQIESAPDGTTAAKLEALLPAELSSNREEREKLIGILGLCGLLGTPEHPSFRAAFVPAAERRLPARGHVDMSYPACWWTAADGIDRGSVEELFGHLL